MPPFFRFFLIYFSHMIRNIKHEFSEEISEEKRNCFRTSGKLCFTKSIASQNSFHNPSVNFLCIEQKKLFFLCTLSNGFYFILQAFSHKTAHLMPLYPNNIPSPHGPYVQTDPPDIPLSQCILFRPDTSRLVPV